MKTVNFTEMKSGTKDEYLLLDKYEQDYIWLISQILSKCAIFSYFLEDSDIFATLNTQ